MSERWPALMSKVDAAEYLSISKTTLESLISDADCPIIPRRISSRRIGLLRSELDEWIESLPKHKTLKQRDAMRPGVKA